MQLTSELKLFIREHASDNTDKLLLAASRYPDIDLPFAVNQIIARRQIQGKLPYWYHHDELIYPSRLSTEQCSSELTALYKQQLMRGTSFCDLTGGLGIDTYYFAQKAKSAIYVERFADYCEAARHNFNVLQANNIHVIHADARNIAGELKADTVYIDPARRADCNKRVFALTDCEPDVLQLKPILLENTSRLIIKVSPMADIDETLRLLPETHEIHILAVKNECKELLFILQHPLFYPTEKVEIHAINLLSSTDVPAFVFRLEEEKAAEPILTEQVEQYLYEPHAALLKSGAFKLVASRYSVSKLHKHSHLYTSQHLYPDFPGRIFQVDTTYEFSGKLLKTLNRQIPKANLTTRNFPLSVDELRKRSKIKEGGDIYLFATTLANERKILIKTHKA